MKKPNFITIIICTVLQSAQCTMHIYTAQCKLNYFWTACATYVKTGGICTNKYMSMILYVFDLHIYLLGTYLGIKGTVDVF